MTGRARVGALLSFVSRNSIDTCVSVDGAPDDCHTSNLGAQAMDLGRSNGIKVLAFTLAAMF